MHSRVKLIEMIRSWEQGDLCTSEVFSMIWEHLSEFPEETDDVLAVLTNHADEALREVVPRIRKHLRRWKGQIKDINHIRLASPLKPGTFLLLRGGYSPSPWWLDDHEYYQGTFLRFVERGANTMPVAFVELEDAIDLTEASGQRHKGRYALLKLLYVADWVETGTVTVHIVDSLPENVGAFYSFHPFGTEIESHATYLIASVPCRPAAGD